MEDDRFFRSQKEILLQRCPNLFSSGLEDHLLIVSASVFGSSKVAAKLYLSDCRTTEKGKLRLSRPATGLL